MFLSTLFAALQRWHRCREAARTLHGFSDNELRDIGLGRSNISDAVWHGR